MSTRRKEIVYIILAFIVVMALYVGVIHLNCKLTGLDYIVIGGNTVRCY